MLLSHGTAVVTDFGIAKAISAAWTQDQGAAVTLTQAGGSIGTPAYMAPEQAVGDAVDHRTDLYAWGVMAYELLTGAHPFGHHATPQQLITAHLSEPPAPIGVENPGVPPALTTLVMQCLEKDASRRPASAAEVLAGLDGTTTPVPSGQTAAIRIPRRKTTGILVAAAVLVVVLGGLALLRGWRGGPGRAGPAEQSLAVLPLANLSGDPADDYFGIGLAEEITRAVAQTG